jgi:hypothetical protein
MCNGASLDGANIGTANDLIFVIERELVRIYCHTGKIPGVIIIDPLISFIGCSENSSDEIRASVDRLSKLCRQYGNITPLIIDHQGKGAREESRGSSAKRDYLRIEYGLSKASEAVTKSHIDAVKANGFEINESKVSLMRLRLLKENDLDIPVGTDIFYQNDDLSFRKLGTKHGANIKQQVEEEEYNQLFDFISDGCSHKELLEEVMDIKQCKERSAATIITNLVEKGQILKSGNRKTLVYSLPE